jgi:hypothetical protein
MRGLQTTARPPCGDVAGRMCCHARRATLGSGGRHKPFRTRRSRVRDSAPEPCAFPVGASWTSAQRSLHALACLALSNTTSPRFGTRPPNSARPTGRCIDIASAPCAPARPRARPLLQQQAVPQSRDARDAGASEPQPRHRFAAEQRRESRVSARDDCATVVPVRVLTRV